MPRTITISEQVWKKIAELGKFGETEDDVLRRVFELPSRGHIAAPQTNNAATRSTTKVSPRRSFATDRMSSYVSGKMLYVSFNSGPSGSWKLPPKEDKNAIRAIRDTATSFAKEQGATVGQVNAVKKALTDSGYYVTK